MIRTAKPQDCVKLCEIYNHYVVNTTITFEDEVVSPSEFQKRLEDITQKYPYLVYEKDDEVLGFAYATTFRKRIAYQNSVETSVYVHKNHYKKGIGLALYQSLIQKLRSSHFKTAIGGITLPNDPSIAFHEKLGFKKVGHFKEVGYKFDKWLDVGFWQLMLDE